MHCKKTFIEKEIDQHHVHPKFMDNKNGIGIKLNLCKSCHNKCHLIIPSLYWELLSKEQKRVAISKVKSFCKKYGGIS